MNRTLSALYPSYLTPLALQVERWLSASLALQVEARAPERALALQVERWLSASLALQVEARAPERALAL
jgi:hypothetical protein